jgi:mono/diheme cytochrome c family protein
MEASVWESNGGRLADMKAVRVGFFCLALGSFCASGFAMQKGKKAGDAGNVANGKIVFGQCSMCHNPNTADKKIGPGLKGLFHRAKLANGKKPTDASVMAQINDGGAGMPAYNNMLSAQEKQDLLAFLKTL